MKVLIIGGGWSGLAAAVTLCQGGHQIQLVEAAKQLGGRARSLHWQESPIDNGQHLIIGAYHALLSMLLVVGVDINTAFHRQTLDLTLHHPRYSSLHLSAKNPLPWPWSLAWSLWRSLGFSAIKQFMAFKKTISGQIVAEDQSVSQWLQETKQSERLIVQLWRPLCLATLNTDIDHASAKVFATVLSKSLMSAQDNADLLLPKLPLQQLFPEPAAHYLKTHGQNIDLQTRIDKLLIEKGSARGAIAQNGKTFIADQVIIATPPNRTAELLASKLPYPKPDYHPVVTIYLKYPRKPLLPKAIVGMTGGYAQWLFDCSHLNPGLIACVISGPGRHQQLDNDQLTEVVLSEVRQQFPTFPNTPKDVLVLRDQRATFQCNVNIHRHRPSTKTAVSCLWLAGDYTENPFPATLEGAVRNGRDCARQIIDQVE